MTLLAPTASGLYCAAGGFHIDPCRPVERAVITHAHADHARAGSRRYLCARPGWRVLRRRLGFSSAVDLVDYGREVVLDGVRVSLHPAGHILGSAQVRVERGGEVWVVTGDYKRAPDPTCASFEPVRAHVLVTEATFAHPAFRWPEAEDVLRHVQHWWRENQAASRPSVLLAYSLGKAQRVLASIDTGLGPVLVHSSIDSFNRDYRESGVPMPRVTPLRQAPRDLDWGRALVLAPPHLRGSRSLPRSSTTALASGWMCASGAPQRHGVERGFVLSDHADWQGVIDTVKESGAERVWTLHGHAEELAAQLRSMGLDACAVACGGQPKLPFRPPGVDGEG
jgi:putative mRNA 3-end processing factor